MAPQHLLRSLARMLPLLVLSLALPHAALSQPAAPDPAELAPEARARLAQAAEDTLLAPWQRDLMLGLARTGTTATLDPPAADLRAARPALASGAADGAWNLLLRTPPSARSVHSAIYDPVRDRMVVFGGYSGAYLDDVWALSLAGTPAWTQLTPSGTPPRARYYHSAIYDPVRDRMLVSGGLSMGGYLNDAWTLEWNFNTAVEDPEPPPLVSGLRPPAPNPTRGTTAVSYALAQAGRVQLGVYDVSGRLVRQLVDAERRAGTETVVWNGMAESGARLEAGVYFVRLAAPGFRETRRVILLR
jgi:hypothetical protein